MEDQAGAMFPEGFVWGAAAAAFQTEGAQTEDGRGPSIWDTFEQAPGNIERNETAQVASDFYHRWPQDLDLMQALGIQAFRFSTAWPRILPLGTGAVNPKGLDYYDRLVDGLLARSIEPYLTLYHWDLPQALQDQGGWAQRATADAFQDYTVVVARRLGDRVRHWITLNEPMVVTMIGHLLGRHAPGERNPLKVLPVAVNQMVAHGLAVQVLRAELPEHARVGVTLNLSPVYPATESEQDRAAAQRFDAAINGLFLDPILLGKPPGMAGEMLGVFAPRVSAEDLQTIAQPLDFLGVNYYTRNVVRHDPQVPLAQLNEVKPEGNEYSMMWEIYPHGIYEVLQRVWEQYLRPFHPAMRILITENGVPVPDGVDADGRVRDERRIRYLRSHLKEVAQAIEHGVPVDGYFHWSLTDNFEWAFGYRMRFGLVYVDFDTQERIIKDSGRWYADVIRQNMVA